LSTSGTGQITQSGQTFLGTYSLLLTENPNGTKSVLLTFAGVSNTGATTAFATSEVADNLADNPKSYISLLMLKNEPLLLSHFSEWKDSP
jgi:hypothetical protein